MVKLRININILAILLIPVYLLVVGNSIRNRHSHVLPNGMVITHSHPFTDAKGLPVKHSHSRNQIVFFQLFTFDFFDSSPEVFMAEKQLNAGNEILIFYSDHTPAFYYSSIFLRGPPTA